MGWWGPARRCQAVWMACGCRHASRPPAWHQLLPAPQRTPKAPGTSQPRQIGRAPSDRTCLAWPGEVEGGRQVTVRPVLPPSHDGWEAVPTPQDPQSPCSRPAAEGRAGRPRCAPCPQVRAASGAQRLGWPAAVRVWLRVAGSRAAPPVLRASYAGRSRLLGAAAAGGHSGCHRRRPGCA